MKSEIIIYQSHEMSTRIEARYEMETIWLTQAQIVSLFDSSKANISEHTKNVFNSGELKEMATVRKFRTVQKEGFGKKMVCLFKNISGPQRFNQKIRQWLVGSAHHQSSLYFFLSFSINKTGLLFSLIEDRNCLTRSLLDSGILSSLVASSIFSIRPRAPTTI